MWVKWGNMNKDVKDLWVKALRSGEYKQGKKSLQHGEEFCCLGVLCQIAPPSVEVKRFGENLRSELIGFSLQSQPAVRLWAQIRFDDPRTPGLHCLNNTTLSALNDSGKTFNEIADVIEANWEEL